MEIFRLTFSLRLSKCDSAHIIVFISSCKRFHSTIFNDIFLQLFHAMSRKMSDVWRKRFADTSSKHLDTSKRKNKNNQVDSTDISNRWIHFFSEREREREIEEEINRINPQDYDTYSALRVRTNSCRLRVHGRARYRTQDSCASRECELR